MSRASMDWKEEKPLPEVTCSSRDCERDLHSFLRPRPRDQSYRNEKCVECGANLIDWHRLDRHDLSDVDYTVEALEHECVRHYYWHKPLDERAVNHALRKGLSGLREAVERRLWKSVAPPRAQNSWDGRQTPKSGNVIYFAQHATATCCRRCIEAWHKIDRNRSLTEPEHGYMTALIMRYIRTRMPDLPEHGQHVPRSRESANF
jgi:hypothetical protein